MLLPSHGAPIDGHAEEVVQELRSEGRNAEFLEEEEPRKQNPSVTSATAATPRNLRLLILMVVVMRIGYNFDCCCCCSSAAVLLDVDFCGVDARC